VVLKEFVLPSHAGIEVSSRTLENIQREETLLKTLEHDQIVKILDFFVEDHRAYLVLEYIEGPSLKKLVESEGRLSEDKAINFGVQICEILNYLHAQQPPVVHRDLTPDNLIVTTDGALKLIDFNVAQQLESTSTRTIVGKHCYIPPEQFRGKASAQSDLYAAGATMFFLLTGTEPEPITVSHPITAQEDVSAKLDEIVAKATQPELAKRYQTSAELMRDLLELREARSDDEPT
jgi:serine/threonine protein kinase, bacterial